MHHYRCGDRGGRRHARPVRPARNPQHQAGAAGAQRHGRDVGSAGRGTETFDRAATTHHKAILAPRRALAAATTVIQVTAIERAIAHLKNWKTLATGYRRNWVCFE